MCFHSSSGGERGKEGAASNLTILARAAEEPSEDKKDMVICNLGPGKEPANPLPDEGVPIPDGKLQTEGPQGAKVGAKLWRYKYLLGAGAFLFLCLVISVIWISLTPGTVAPSSAAPLPCSNGWIQNEERCYFFSVTEANWNDSQSHCSSFDDSLVTIETQQEMDFIQRSKNHPYIWIGLWREKIDQPWKRPNGSLFNNSFSIHGEGDCAYWNEDKIRSTRCINSQFRICSKPALTSRVML